jgi:hypothetical protein
MCNQGMNDDELMWKATLTHIHLEMALPREPIATLLEILEDLTIDQLDTVICANKWKAKVQRHRRISDAEYLEYLEFVKVMKSIAKSDGSDEPDDV